VSSQGSNAFNNGGKPSQDSLEVLVLHRSGVECHLLPVPQAPRSAFLSESPAPSCVANTATLAGLIQPTRTKGYGDDLPGPGVVAGEPRAWVFGVGCFESELAIAPADGIPLEALPSLLGRPAQDRTLRRRKRPRKGLLNTAPADYPSGLRAIGAGTMKTLAGSRDNRYCRSGPQAADQF
jgi:hypothetical protein